MKNAEITIVHALRNRIRLHFHEPPVHSDKVIQIIKELSGVKKCSYSEVTRNMLITFDSKEIQTLSVLKEVVLSLSTQYCMRSTTINVKNSFHPTALSVLSLISLASAYLIHTLTPKTMMRNKHGKTPNIFEYGVAGFTGLAVLEHAAIEVHKTGIFDPEAFSVLYLFNQMKEKQPIKGALVTWFASFGRHLLPIVQMNRITFKVIEGVDIKTGRKYTDVITSGSLSLLEQYNKDVPTNKKELVKGVFERYKQSQFFAVDKFRLNK